MIWKILLGLVLTAIIIPGIQNSEASYIFYIDKWAPSLVSGFFPNEYPLVIDDTTFKYKQFKDRDHFATIQVVVPTKIQLKIFDEAGPHVIVNSTLVFNYNNGLQTRQATISWFNENPIHKDHPLGWIAARQGENQPDPSGTTVLGEDDYSIKINDPYRLFSEVNTTTSYSNYKLDLTYDVSFRKLISNANVTISTTDNFGNMLNSVVIDALKTYG